MSTQATPDQPKESRSGIYIGVPLAVLVLAVWLVVTAWQRFGGAAASSCPTTFSPDGWFTGGFFAVIGAFLLGGLLPSPPHRKEKSGWVTQLGITGLVAIIAVALWYETRAVAAGSNDLLPLTHFVMCIKSFENDWTLFVFVLAALLVGRWLWHRPRTYLQ